MNPKTLETAEAFLRRTYKDEKGHTPTDEQLTDWCFIQWAEHVKQGGRRE
ncbi:MAG: hypothetical protein V4510_04835 [bacterium]